MSKKIKIEIKSWLNGSVLFEYETVDNTMRETVLEAIKQNANLSYADLSYADLSSANLSYADLSSANLRYANLSYADLSYADLRYADLSSANLRYANLSSAKNSEWAVAVTRILPEGDLIGYKKCRDNKIVKLLIPKEAKRSSAFGRKCRAEYAEVLEIAKGSRQLKTAVSDYDSSFKYKVGDTVKPVQGFSEEWENECAPGIHFYITKLEAENN